MYCFNKCIEFCQNFFKIVYHIEKKRVNLIHFDRFSIKMNDATRLFREPNLLFGKSFLQVLL